MTTISQRLPKSFFQNKMSHLQNRLKALQYFLQKATTPGKRQQIQSEIESTNLAIKRTELDSCFSRLEGDE